MPSLNLRLTQSELDVLREWAGSSHRSIQQEVTYRLFRSEEKEHALAAALDVAIWLSANIPDEAQETWQQQMRPKLFSALALSEGGKV